MSERRDRGGKGGRLVHSTLAQNCGTRTEESGSANTQKDRNWHVGRDIAMGTIVTVTVDPPRLVKLDAAFSRLEPWLHNLNFRP